MTRFSNVPGAAALASGRSGSIYASAAEIGREIADAWKRHDRADVASLAVKGESARKARADALGAAIYDYARTLEQVLAETPACTVDDALAQVMIAGGATSLLEDAATLKPMDNEEVGRLAKHAGKLIDCVIRFLATQTTTPAEELGGRAFLTPDMQAEIARLTGRASA